METATTIDHRIQQTTDYDLFKDIGSNRETDSKHVNRLARSIQDKNLLHIHPIVVDMHMRVIDGQHRLEAAKQLGVPVFFVVDGAIEKKDISRLNTNQKNWNMMDYINYYTVEKIPEYIELSKFINHYEHLKPSAAIALCSSTLTSRSADIKQGYMDIDNINRAYEVAENLKEIYRKYQEDFIWDSRFPIALARAMRDSNFNMEVFYEKIDGNRRAFVRCVTVLDTVKMVQEIYNYKLSKNKIAIV